MPRYRYKCEGCHKTQSIFHRMSETVNKCPQCNMAGKMTKLLTTPTIVTTPEESSPEVVGEITKQYIESNREILEQQKEDAKKETYEPS
jgi:putative FmdB family regulatory protein